MKTLTVVGARPQFVKAAPVTRSLSEAGIEEVVVHTGQHYDFEMSQIFFDELKIPPPAHHLGVGSGLHGQQTGAMLAALEDVVVREKPDLLLVYGDTNSTLAGALCASKLHVPVAHVEAGLRSFNRRMPEEINRVVTDHLSALLFCPGDTAVDNLRNEGIHDGVSVVGDVMLDVLNEGAAAADAAGGILDRLALRRGDYLLTTIHRAELTDDPGELSSVLDVLSALDELVVFPVHPRTRKRIEALAFTPPPSLILLEPVGYVDMLRLQRYARMIVTDSGGVQKEAYWQGVPCLTLRGETEWVETVANGWNRLCGVGDLAEAVKTFQPPAERPPLYGDGFASARVARTITTWSQGRS